MRTTDDTDVTFDEDMQYLRMLMERFFRTAIMNDADLSHLQLAEAAGAEVPPEARQAEAAVEEEAEAALEEELGELETVEDAAELDADGGIDELGDAAAPDTQPEDVEPGADDGEDDEDDESEDHPRESNGRFKKSG